MKYSITTTSSTKTPLTFEKLNPGDVFMMGNGNDASSLFLVLHDRYAPLKEDPKGELSFFRYNAVSLAGGKCTTVKPDTKVKLLIKELSFNENDFTDIEEPAYIYLDNSNPCYRNSSNKTILNEKVDKEKSSKLDELMKDFETSYYSYPKNLVN